MGANQSRVRIPQNLGLPFRPVVALGSNLLSHLSNGQVLLFLLMARSSSIYLRPMCGSI